MSLGVQHPREPSPGVRRLLPVERTMLVKPCACGGVIRANRFEPATYMRSHQRSLLHEAWRLAQEAM